jgi:CubicO group peptidase (beta-lactamase class C family)
MKNIKFLITSIVLGLLLTPTIALAQTGGMKLGGNTLKFDKAKFVGKVKSDFEGKVTGYQVVLVKDGKIVSEIGGGYATNAVDGSNKMTVNTPANIGSTAKFFGGTALLHEFQRTSGIGGGMDSWLSEKIYNYFPVVWKQNMHESIKQISFKDLLQHRSGFIQGDKDAKDGFFGYIKKGVSNDKSQDFYYGKRNYANANITMVGYLLPMVADKNFLKSLNTMIIEKKLKADDMAIQTYLGNAFEAHVKKNYFSKITPAIAPSCDARNEYPKKNIIFAKSYNIWNDISPGADYSSKVDNLSKACHASGGWYITGRELAAYVANFAASDTIVTAATRKKMFDDKKPDDRLLWSNARGDTLLKTKLNWNSSPYMGGDHGGAHGTIVMLPNGYYAVGIINSAISPVNKGDDFGNSHTLTKNIISAFEAGIAANF